MTTLQNLQTKLFTAQCKYVFSMIEHQSSLGIGQHELQWMPRALWQLLPITPQTFEFRGLLKMVRVFDPAKAQQLLELLEFSDFPKYLQQHGYDASKEEFICRLQMHVQSEQAKLMSLF